MSKATPASAGCGCSNNNRHISPLRGQLLLIPALLLALAAALCLWPPFPHSIFSSFPPQYALPLANGDPLTPKQHISVFVLVTSRGTSMDRRQLLRPQFNKSLSLLAAKMGESAVRSIVIRYVFGKDMWHARREEAEKFGDVVFLDCPDGDPNGTLGGGTSATTLKVMRGIAWVVERYTFEYLFRLGDDAYCRIDYFRQLIAEGRFARERLLLGFILYNGAEVGGFRVPYASGMGFVLSYDICKWIAVAGEGGLLMDTWPEDAMVGRWVAAVKVTVQHYPEGFMDYDWNLCSEKAIVIHKLPVTAWGRIGENGLLLNCTRH